MRNIRFRTWNKVSETMYTDAINNCVDSFDLVLKHPQIYEVMEFTGLKDKNGKEIFEGDLCKEIKSGKTLNSLLQIIWSNKYEYGVKVLEGRTLTKGLIFPLWHWDKLKENGYRQLEILGNIYENPELLEGEENANN